MGLANLVPGVSGGTMIVVMGLYDEFVNSIAEVTRLKFTRRSLAFLGVVGACAIAVIATAAGPMGLAVTRHRSAMFSLFVGMTLGGVPVLMKLLRGVTAPSLAGFLIGLSAIVVIAATNHQPAARHLRGSQSEQTLPVVSPNYDRDVVLGILGMSAMVLPGISGAYMLLLLGRYETILAAIAEAKDFALSGRYAVEGLSFLHVLAPTAGGAIVGLVCISNLLKWLLLRFHDATIGALLGILVGSVVGIWPFDRTSRTTDIAVGLGLAVAGFAVTTLLARIRT